MNSGTGELSLGDAQVVLVALLSLNCSQALDLGAQGALREAHPWRLKALLHLLSQKARIFLHLHHEVESSQDSSICSGVLEQSRR